TTVLLQVQHHHRLDPATLLGVEVAACAQMVGQRPGLVEGPGLERSDELALVNQPVLQREQAEEEIARGIDGAEHGNQLPLEASRVITGAASGAKEGRRSGRT